MEESFPPGPFRRGFERTYSAVISRSGVEQRQFAFVSKPEPPKKDNVPIAIATPPNLIGSMTDEERYAFAEKIVRGMAEPQGVDLGHEATDRRKGTTAPPAEQARPA
jgi:hypothetical protein